MIPTASLEEYGSVIRSLLRSQASHTSGPLDPDAFRRSTHIPILRNERPDWITVLERAFERHWATVSRYPSVLTHYDCNPYNAYPKGMIDFETSGAGPWGYDAVSAICAIGWFPEAGDFERTGAYVYTDEQIAAYYHMLDTYALEKNLPPISEAREAFEFFRGVWACARMGDVPKLQAWRYARFERIFLERI
ncbi:MAG TPA: phosphotransferase [bacterium]|nr:phosphotransferase [bacterium]